MTSKYAIIEAGKVINIAVASAPLSAKWVLWQEGVAIGWHYQDGAFEAPLEPTPEPTPLEWPRFTGNEKLDLFTQAEQLAVVTATLTDPQVKLMYDRLINAAYITYEDPEMEQGLAMLVQKELLTQERKEEIVALMQPR